MILAGDIGGTKTVLAVFEITADGVGKRFERRYPSRDYGDFGTILRTFVGELREPPEAVCLGVAGPVIEGQCRTTNLPWLLEEQAIAEEAGARRARLLNDLEAAAFGMLHLGPDQRVELNPDARGRQGNMAVIAAGTGLGEAVLFWDGERYRPMATEGGHTDFAPRNALEDRLLAFARKRHPDHVSYERIVSGPGLHLLYDFLQAEGRRESATTARQLGEGGDPGAIIGQAAMEGNDALATEALELFVALYGAEAGNLALKSLAVGGVMIGGGIAPRILPVLRDGRFMESFLAKGAFGELLQTMPVTVVTEPEAPLLGAAHYARRLL